MDKVKNTYSEDDSSEDMTFEEVEGAKMEVLVEGEPGTEPEAPADELLGKTKEELAGLVRAAQAEAQKKDPISALSQGFEQLNQTLARPQYHPQTPQTPRASVSDVLREKLLDNSEEALDYYHEQKLRPDLERLMASNMINSKRFAKLDPETGPLMKKYEQEIEKEVFACPPNQQLGDTEIYQKAIERVKMRHLDTIVEEKAMQLAEEIVKKMNLAPAPAAPPRSKSFNEVSNRPSSSGKKLIISREKMDKLKREAAMSPLDEADYIRLHAED